MFFIYPYIYILREREYGGGVDEEGEKDSREGFMPSTEPDAGVHLMTLRS